MKTAPSLKIIPKPKPKMPSWVGILFWVALVLLLFTVILFFILQGRASSLGGKKESIERQISEVEKETNEIGEKEVLEVSKQLKSFAGLFEQHKIGSRFFDFVKSTCHPYTQFDSFSLEIGNGRTSLTGTTENFRTLGQQLLVLREHKDIQDLKVGAISLNQEGRVTFQLTFTLADTVFKK